MDALQLHHKHLNLNPTSEYQKGTFTLHIQVVQCRGLESADFDGYSDPYVSIRVDGSDEERKKKAYTTAVLNNTLNPIFHDEFFSFTLSQGFTKFDLIRVQIKDHDRTNHDDELGCCSIPLFDLLQKGVISGWFQIHTSIDINSETTYGLIHLRIVLDTVLRDTMVIKKTFAKDDDSVWIAHRHDLFRLLYDAELDYKNRYAALWYKDSYQHLLLSSSSPDSISYPPQQLSSESYIALPPPEPLITSSSPFFAYGPFEYPNTPCVPIGMTRMEDRFKPLRTVNKAPSSLLLQNQSLNDDTIQNDQHYTTSSVPPVGQKLSSLSSLRVQYPTNIQSHYIYNDNTHTNSYNTTINNTLVTNTRSHNNNNNGLIPYDNDINSYMYTEHVGYNDDDNNDNEYTDNNNTDDYPTTTSGAATTSAAATTTAVTGIGGSSSVSDVTEQSSLSFLALYPPPAPLGLTNSTRTTKPDVPLTPPTLPPPLPVTAAAKHQSHFGLDLNTVPRTPPPLPITKPEKTTSTIIQEPDSSPPSTIQLGSLDLSDLDLQYTRHRAKSHTHPPSSSSSSTDLFTSSSLTEKAQPPIKLTSTHRIPINTTDPLPSYLPYPMQYSSYPSVAHVFKLGCASWNVGNTSPDSPEALREWLDGDVDIYVIGTQENSYSVKNLSNTSSNNNNNQTTTTTMGSITAPNTDNNDLQPSSSSLQHSTSSISTQGVALVPISPPPSSTGATQQSSSLNSIDNNNNTSLSSINTTTNGNNIDDDANKATVVKTSRLAEGMFTGSANHFTSMLLSALNMVPFNQHNTTTTHTNSSSNNNNNTTTTEQTNLNKIMTLPGAASSSTTATSQPLPLLHAASTTTIPSRLTRSTPGTTLLPSDTTTHTVSPISNHSSPFGDSGTTTVLQPTSTGITTATNISTTSNQWQTLPPRHPDAYTLLRHVSMGQIMIHVYAKNKVLPYIDLVQASKSFQPTGVAGVGFNKGGVAIGLDILGTSYLFINSHLAAHTPELDKRNEDQQSILSNLKFKGLRQDKRLVDAFHHIIWMGDLNYRLETAGLSTSPKLHLLTALKQLIARQQWAQLYYRDDQLYRSIINRKGFNGFIDCQPLFAPTFKVLTVKAMCKMLSKINKVSALSSTSGSSGAGSSNGSSNSSANSSSSSSLVATSSAALSSSKSMLLRLGSYAFNTVSGGSSSSNNNDKDTNNTTPNKDIVNSRRSSTANLALVEEEEEDEDITTTTTMHDKDHNNKGKKNNNNYEIMDDNNQVINRPHRQPTLLSSLHPHANTTTTTTSATTSSSSTVPSQAPIAPTPPPLHAQNSVRPVVVDPVTTVKETKEVSPEQPSKPALDRLFSSFRGGTSSTAAVGAPVSATTMGAAASTQSSDNIVVAVSPPIAVAELDSSYFITAEDEYGTNITTTHHHHHQSHNDLLSTTTTTTPTTNNTTNNSTNNTSNPHTNQVSSQKGSTYHSRHNSTTALTPSIHSNNTTSTAITTTAVSGASSSTPSTTPLKGSHVTTPLKGGHPTLLSRSSSEQHPLYTGSSHQQQQHNNNNNNNTDTISNNNTNTIAHLPSSTSNLSSSTIQNNTNITPAVTTTTTNSSTTLQDLLHSLITVINKDRKIINYGSSGKGIVAYTNERTPSWCDRILYRSLPGWEKTISLVSFISAECVESSDHKPVRAHFNLYIPQQVSPVPQSTMEPLDDPPVKPPIPTRPATSFVLPPLPQNMKPIPAITSSSSSPYNPDLATTQPSQVKLLQSSSSSSSSLMIPPPAPQPSYLRIYGNKGMDTIIKLNIHNITITSLDLPTGLKRGGDIMPIKSKLILDLADLISSKDDTVILDKNGNKRPLSVSKITDYATVKVDTLTTLYSEQYTKRATMNRLLGRPAPPYIYDISCIETLLLSHNSTANSPRSSFSRISRSSHQSLNMGTIGTSAGNNNNNQQQQQQISSSSSSSSSPPQQHKNIASEPLVSSINEPLVPPTPPPGPPPLPLTPPPPPPPPHLSIPPPLPQTTTSSSLSSTGTTQLQRVPSKLPPPLPPHAVSKTPPPLPGIPPPFPSSSPPPPPSSTPPPPPPPVTLPSSTVSSPTSALANTPMSSLPPPPPQSDTDGTISNDPTSPRFGLIHHTPVVTPQGSHNASASNLGHTTQMYNTPPHQQQFTASSHQHHHNNNNTTSSSHTSEKRPKQGRRHLQSQYKYKAEWESSQLPSLDIARMPSGALSSLLLPFKISISLDKKKQYSKESANHDMKQHHIQNRDNNHNNTYTTIPSSSSFYRDSTRTSNTLNINPDLYDTTKNRSTFSSTNNTTPLPRHSSHLQSSSSSSIHVINEYDRGNDGDDDDNHDGHNNPPPPPPLDDYSDDEDISCIDENDDTDDDYDDNDTIHTSHSRSIQHGPTSPQNTTKTLSIQNNSSNSSNIQQYNDVSSSTTTTTTGNDDDNTPTNPKTKKSLLGFAQRGLRGMRDVVSTTINKAFDHAHNRLARPHQYTGVLSFHSIDISTLFDSNNITQMESCTTPQFSIKTFLHDHKGSIVGAVNVVMEIVRE